jgi:hypothetical protein
MSLATAYSLTETILAACSLRYDSLSRNTTAAQQDHHAEELSLHVIV